MVVLDRCSIKILLRRIFCDLKTELRDPQGGQSCGLEPELVVDTKTSPLTMEVSRRDISGVERGLNISSIVYC